MTISEQSTMNEECNKYIKLLKQLEPELSQEMRALARESFVEGWVQCELKGRTA